MDNKRKLIDAASLYVAQSPFFGNWDEAWHTQDADNDGKIGDKELSAWLQKIGIGNFFTRSSWVDGIMEEVDKNRDGFITKAEFMSVFNQEN